jgi:hypothetical protein
MPSASQRVLRDLFTNHLHFTPTARDIETFEADLAVVSPSLMKASLKEIGAVRGPKPAGAGQWRDALYVVYNRKVAEHAQLFPVFHCFETAFRSTLAIEMEGHYKIAQWWMPVENIQRKGGDLGTLSRIGIVDPASARAIKSIGYLLQDLRSRKIDVTQFQDGYALLEHSTLGHVKGFVSEHWSIFTTKFVKNGQPLSRDHFADKFDRIILARNAVYHHQSFSGMTDVYKTASELLAYIGFPLPLIHQKIAQARCAPPSYAR